MISVRLPSALKDHLEQLTGLLGSHVTRTAGAVAVRPSRRGYLPAISFRCDSDQPFAKADFRLSAGETRSVDIENTTGVRRRNPSRYRHVPMQEVCARFTSSRLAIHSIDHIGFNLPWFGPGVHPVVTDLRSRLKAHCLYHRFPTGEPWDFIIPGDSDEIDGSKSADYSQVRKPKFEIVSFSKCSTPLIQIDVAVSLPYAEFSALFTEGLNDPEMKNLWIYVESLRELDICLVLNEPTENDWSSFFKGHRIT